MMPLTPHVTAVEEKKVWEERLENLKVQSDFLAKQERADPVQRARILAQMGALCCRLGRPDEMVRYGRLARELAPDEPALRDWFRFLDLYQHGQGKTPWDADGAVDQYDDLSELLLHRDLPFDQFFSETRRGPIRKQICRFLSVLARPGQRLLEVGCAAGGYYASLKPFIDVSRYVAVDLTPGMVRRAKHVFPPLDALCMDIRELGFPDNCFPIVFSVDVLMHLKEWRTGLFELYRAASHALVLRIRVHIDRTRPTLVAQVGSGTFRVPYIINNRAEFEAVVRGFDPPPQDILSAPLECEVMYDALWQIARDHPELLEGQNPNHPVIDGVLDMVILKRRPGEAV